MTQVTTPGKIILFGEHAVVYGRPAIAAPITQVRATAIVEPGKTNDVQIIAADLGVRISLNKASPKDALATAVRLVQKTAKLSTLPPLTITVTSQIPIASGLGSGAAIIAAIIRALAIHLQLTSLTNNEQVSALTYEVEKIYHGTPSGIDNTVVAFEQPVYFVRQQPQNRIETFTVARPLHFLVANTGISSSTKAVVGDVRRQWQAQKTKFESLFDACGQLVDTARQAIEQGNLSEIGRLMIENHLILSDMTVSSPALDQLVTAVLKAGAYGAKLSGAGRGGNMIALIAPETETAVRQALVDAGAKAILNNIIQ